MLTPNEAQTEDILAPSTLQRCVNRRGAPEINKQRGYNSTRYRLILSGVWVALSCFMLPGWALAACQLATNYEQEGGLSGWPVRVANSADEKLKTDFANGTCRYRKGQHSGGITPGNAPNNDHITVIRSDSVQCHVFKKSPNLAAGSPNPTTCF